jgi:hypothetical protein
LEFAVGRAEIEVDETLIQRTVKAAAPDGELSWSQEIGQGVKVYSLG